MKREQQQQQQQKQATQKMVTESLSNNNAARNPATPSKKSTPSSAGKLPTPGGGGGGGGGDVATKTLVTTTDQQQQQQEQPVVKKKRGRPVGWRKADHSNKYKSMREAAGNARKALGGGGRGGAQHKRYYSDEEDEYDSDDYNNDGEAFNKYNTKGSDDEGVGDGDAPPGREVQQRPQELQSLDVLALGEGPREGLVHVEKESPSLNLEATTTHAQERTQSRHDGEHEATLTERGRES